MNIPVGDAQGVSDFQLARGYLTGGSAIGNRGFGMNLDIAGTSCETGWYVYGSWRNNGSTPGMSPMGDRQW